MTSTTFGALPIGATFDIPGWGLLGQGETKVTSTSARSARGNLGTIEASREVIPVTPLEHCRRLLVLVDAAAGNREALGAAYALLVGHDSAGEPGADLGAVHDTLRDFVREVSASLGVAWSDVDPLEGAPAPAGWILPVAEPSHAVPASNAGPGAPRSCPDGRGFNCRHCWPAV